MDGLWGNIWPVGQAVKTPASHAGNGGSIPQRVTRVSTLPLWGSEPERALGVKKTAKQFLAQRGAAACPQAVKAA